MVERIVTEEPPPRLNSQLYPSTNTLVITIHDDIEPAVNLQHDIFNILPVDVAQLQCLDFSNFELSRQIRATFFDVRESLRAFVNLQSDNRVEVNFDLENGTNRSVVFPRGNVALDLIHSRMSEFGEIEKIWFKMPITNYDRDNVVVDFFDSRAPLNIVRKLENAF
jgi:hypothetical protein